MRRYSFWIVAFLTLVFSLCCILSSVSAQTFQILITSPESGDVISASPAVVQGMLTALPGRDVGVTVNGVAAMVEEDQFAALVPVDPQVTSLRAVASDGAATLGSHTVPVTVKPTATEPILSFLAQPVEGAAPLQVMFSLASLVPIVQVTLDLEGSGEVTFKGPNLAGQSFTYAEPGIYTPTVEVTDLDGETYTATTLVHVYNRSALDAHLQAAWRGFKDALRAGQVDRAVMFIHSSTRADYQAYLRQFPAATLANIDRWLTTIRLVEAGLGGAQYEMLRERGGQTFSFAVWFEIDADGVWRPRRF